MENHAPILILRQPKAKAPFAVLWTQVKHYLADLAHKFIMSRHKISSQLVNGRTLKTTNQWYNRCMKELMFFGNYTTLYGEKLSGGSSQSEWLLSQDDARLTTSIF